MFNYYSRRNVNIIALFISIIIFLLINKLNLNLNINHNLSFKQMDFQVSFNSSSMQESFSQTNIVEKSNNIEENTTEEKNKLNWQIEIPDISLVAEIAEGTTEDILDQYVGHFEETQTKNGNIGLAAHNRGYKVNYFENLKKLEYGAEIIYTCGDFCKKYIVETVKIIKNTDWTYLEKTEDNRITLITCVENQPEYRRCIQGIEKESEEF